MYILCGSEGCDLGAVKWSPDIVSRSAKWCKMKVRDSVIRQRVSEVRDKAKVQRCKGTEVRRQSRAKR